MFLKFTYISPCRSGSNEPLGPIRRRFACGWIALRSIIMLGISACLCADVSARGAIAGNSKTGQAPPQQRPATLQEPFTNTIGQTFVYIKPGSFLMGSPLDEPGRSADEPQHRETLTKGFYLQMTEVTQGQWHMVMEKNPAQFQGCGDLCPVESVSWDDVRKFIDILNQRPGTHRYRLPTEAEWEYAARAGTTGPFAGSSVDSMAWYRDNAGNRTYPVGMKTPNSWGLYDMHGNVSEWVQDWYGDYPSGSAIDPAGPSSGFYRVDRGGSWYGVAQNCRVAYRDYDGPSYRRNYLGFRLVRTF
jgi:formylglycine-generating enzyme required for sulfatase activity